jgi:nucleotide-binding universal stress UspA family protein
MTKRILVLLDDTASSKTARQYALQLARSTNAELVGLAGVDIEYIESTMPGRGGMASYKASLESKLKEQTRAINLQVRGIFERECNANDIAFEWKSFEGEPADAISSAAVRCDLVITGHDSAFRGKINEQLSEMISKLLVACPRPIIICPDDFPSSEKIMVAYDDSPPAMRAIQIFTLLGMKSNELRHVVAINASRDEAARQAGKAASYLLLHGYQIEENPIQSAERPSRVLIDEVGRLDIGLLVMGAYGHHRLRNLLFGSTTRTLIETPPCALFLYH